MDFPAPVGITARTSFPARSASITASCPSLKVSYPKWVFKSSCFVINRHDPFCYVPTGTVTLLFFIVESLLFSEYIILTYLQINCQLIQKNHKARSPCFSCYNAIRERICLYCPTAEDHKFTEYPVLCSVTARMLIKKGELLCVKEK